jgi:hypothetical protein
MLILFEMLPLTASATTVALLQTPFCAAVTVAAAVFDRCLLLKAQAGAFVCRERDWTHPRNDNLCTSTLYTITCWTLFTVCTSCVDRVCAIGVTVHLCTVITITLPDNVTYNVNWYTLKPIILCYSTCLSTLLFRVLLSVYVCVCWCYCELVCCTVLLALLLVAVILVSFGRALVWLVVLVLVVCAGGRLVMLLFCRVARCIILATVQYILRHHIIWLTYHFLLYYSFQSVAGMLNFTALLDCLCVCVCVSEYENSTLALCV